MKFSLKIILSLGLNTFISLNYYISSRFPLKNVKVHNKYAVKVSSEGTIFPQFDSLYPVRENIPPLVYHIIADESYKNIFELVKSECSDLSMSYFRELIEFGSVYSDILALNVNNLNYNSDDNSPLKKNIVRLSIENTELPISKGTYVRIHASPKRYSAFAEINWKSRIVFMDGNFICVNKPPGIPISMGVDNAIENVKYQLEKYLISNSSHFKDTSLYITGRLDVCTSGLILLAKGSNSASKINSLFQAGTIKKKYTLLCVSKKILKTGVVKNCFKQNGSLHPNSKPTLLLPYSKNFLESNKNWKLAELVVLSCKECSDIDLSSLDINHDIDEDDKLYECEVELITGRTHQIRLQFTFLNAPILGDSLYAPFRGIPFSEESDSKFQTLGRGKDPIKIALQCSELDFSIAFHDGSSSSKPDDLSTRYHFKSNNPWWKQSSS